MVNLVVGVVAAVASEASAFRSRQNNISFVIIIIAVKMMMMMVGVVTWFEVQTPNKVSVISTFVWKNIIDIHS